MANVADHVFETLDFENVNDFVSKEKLVNYFAKVTQFITWPFLAIIFKIFFDIKINGREIFDTVQNPFIIIANHTSFYDSFLFRLILGFRTPHLPLRFMAVNRFDSKHMNFLASLGIIDFIYSLFGVFTVTLGLGIDKNIQKAKQIIHVGGNIVIYPEGSVNKEGNIGQFKHGASALYRQTGVEVVPLSINKIQQRFFRPTIVVNIGNKINVSRSKSTEEITKIFRNTIVALYQK